MRNMTYLIRRHRTDIMIYTGSFSAFMGGIRSGSYYMDNYYDWRPKIITRIHDNDPFVGSLLESVFHTIGITLVVVTGSAASAVLTPVSAPFWVWSLLK